MGSYELPTRMNFNGAQGVEMAHPLVGSIMDSQVHPPSSPLVLQERLVGSSGIWQVHTFDSVYAKSQYVWLFRCARKRCIGSLMRGHSCRLR